jgi:hypothetical protein
MRDPLLPDVINTMPLASSGPAEQILRDVQAAGVDLDTIAAQVEREGVQSFCASYRELLACIDAKLTATISEPS